MITYIFHTGYVKPYGLYSTELLGTVPSRCVAVWLHCFRIRKSCQDKGLRPFTLGKRR